MRFSSISKISGAGGVILRSNIELFGELRALKRRALLAGRYGTTRYRNQFSHEQTRFSHMLFEGLCGELGIDATFAFEGMEDSSLDAPGIVISNHQSTIDIVLLYELMWQLGNTRVRWVMKSDLDRWYNPYGWAGRETRAAFVSRNGDTHDLTRILACGLSARYDGASVCIFPEGTRFMGPKLDSKLALVRTRDPKIGGFSQLCQAMPETDILSITLDWGGRGKPLGRTIWDVDDFVGRKLQIHAKRVSRAEIERVGHKVWLDREWRWKDRRLAELEEAA